MINTTKPLETENLEGMLNYTQIPNENDDINDPAVLLTDLSNYILESVFADYKLTISGECQRSSDRLALTICASHYVLLPLRVDAWTGDRPTSMMLRLSSVLMPSALLSLNCQADAEPSRVLRLTSNGTDQRTDTLLDMMLLPNRARMDAGYIRQRLEISASQWRDRVLRNGKSPGMVLRSLGALAGGQWPRVAAEIARGEVDHAQH